ncbi:MAG: alpha/beta hydrolase [Myxococcota bacterium]|nr:alpha/beta hydrolase [Myxococcota bacterium]
MSDFEQNDVRIHYQETGSGFPVLLFAPGGMKSAIPVWERMPWNPIEILAPHFRVIAMDQRNAGQSVAPISGQDGWHSYTGDHVGLLKELEIDRCHVLGCCIGGSYSLGLMQAVPEKVAAGVLLQPIGASAENREAFYAMFDQWADELKPRRPEVSDQDWRAFRSRMYDGDFVYNVSRDFVRQCDTPLLVLKGDDLYHPGPISQEIVDLAPHATLIDEWKEGAAVSVSARAVVEFLEEKSH